MSEFTGEFVAEAKENLSGIEGILMDLESAANDPDPELINRAFRAVHSIKGGAGFLGLSRLMELSHAMESLMALVRSREIRPSADVVDTLLTGVDLLNEMLDHIDQSEAWDISDSLSSIQEILDRDLHPDVKEEMSETLAVLDETGDKTGFRIDRFTRKQMSQNTGLYLLAFDLNALGAMDGETPLRLIDRLLSYGEILDARIDAPADDLHGDLAEIPLIYEILYASDVSEASLRDQIGYGSVRLAPARTQSRNCDDPATLSKNKTSRDSNSQIRESAAPPGIRVAEEKINALVTLAGEFVTVQAALTAEARAQKMPRLLSIAERVERLSSDLREVALSVGMQPIRTVFGRFRRLIRDLSRQHGKDVTLITEGGGVELDKNVIERLYDPLNHIIRNSVDHGIASPEARTARGKPAQGVITMKARHVGGCVIIEISDDGEGIDVERVRSKALQSGLLSPGEAQDKAISDDSLIQMICAPGFSTMEAVTDLSGRGVGMDVVKRRVASLGGDVTIQSKKGRGTTITLKIPMSMAIIDGLLIRISHDPYFIPLSEVAECVDLRGKTLTQARKRGAMELRGKLIPFLCLSQKLAGDKKLPDDEYVVVVHKGDKLVGLGVGQVDGFHQAVVKPLGKAYRDIKAFSGSTILGDGSVALILDIHLMIQTLDAAGSSIKLQRQ